MLSPFFSIFFFLFLNVYACVVFMDVCAPQVYSACGGQDSLDLELRTAAGTDPGPLEEQERSEPWGHFPRPTVLFKRATPQMGKTVLYSFIKISTFNKLPIKKTPEYIK